MISDFKIEILKLVGKNDGKFSWYQLDRQLTFSGIEISENLMQAVRDLESGGLISSKQGDNPSQPLYFLTSQGKTFVDEYSA